MATIIAGRFDTFDDATHAVELLATAAFGPGSIAVFFNNAPGAHDTFPLGGDENADPGARHAHVNAAAGAAIGATAGIAAAVAAPILAAAAIATTGAYVGALAGAMRGAAGGAPEAPSRRPAGVIVAVVLPAHDREDVAVAALRRSGARDVERSHGEIRDGRWLDFDPVATPQLVLPSTTAGTAFDVHPGD